jgi:hypothetical protein
VVTRPGTGNGAIATLLAALTRASSHSEARASLALVAA